MSRVIEVCDSRTLVIQTAGVSSAVVLRGVTVGQREESAALKYLRGLVLHAWVYVEDGDVYRSPDGLFINAEMRRRAWYGATYMGELPFPPIVPRVSPAAKVKAAKKPPAARKGKKRKN